MVALLLKSLGETLVMVSVSGLVGLLGGVPLGTALYVTAPGRFLARPRLHQILGLLTNLGRSVPFIILLVAIVPLTRFLTGTSIGVVAAIVPLAIGGIPFVARLVEGALQEVPPSQMEAAHSLGASHRQVILRVLLPQALPGIIRAATVLLVTLVSYSAMAGAVGGGGLGHVGISHGYQRFDGTVMLVVVALLVALVQCIQWAGDRWAVAVDRRF